MARLARSQRAPALALAAGTGAVAAFAAFFAAHVTGWTIDETLFKQSALHYTHGLPRSLFHDLTARGTSRLYPLLISPVFGATDGSDAVRIARAISALMFCSTSIPVYLLARRLLASPWAAVAAGLLSIAVPWLTLSSVLFTENAAYPLFAWTLFAMVRASALPSVRSDVLVLVLIALSGTARTQLLILFPAWLVCNWLIARRDAWRAAPVSHALLGLAALALLVRLVMGDLHGDLARVFGQYSELQDRGHVSTDLFLAVAVEWQALLLAALTAVVVATAWFVGALRGPRAAPRWSFAVIAVVVFALLWLFTAYVQGGYLGAATEERYYFYVVPLIWIGALLAIEEPETAAPRLPGVTAAALLLIATLGISLPVTGQTAILAPAMASVQSIFGRLIQTMHLTGLSVRDALAIVCAALLAGAFWGWRRGPRPRLIAVVVLAAVTQIALGAYAYAARSGHVPGVGSDTAGDFDKSAWIDDAVGTDVTWVNNQTRGSGGLEEGRQYEALFWNSHVRDWAHDPATQLPPPVATLAALPMRTLGTDPAHPEVTGLDVGRPVVGQIGSPFLQIAGRAIAHNGFDDLELVAPATPIRAVFLSRGLATDGDIDATKTIELTAFGQGRMAIDLRFVGAQPGPTELAVRVGDAKRTVAFAAGAEKAERLEACATGGRLPGTVRVKTPVTLPDGRSSGGRLVKVKVTPLPGGTCPGA